MTMVFPCRNDLDACFVMTLVWLAKNIEVVPLPSAHAINREPLAILTDAFLQAVHMGTDTRVVSDARFCIQALQLFGFGPARGDWETGTHAASFRPLQRLTTHVGHSFFYISGARRAHALGIRVHGVRWELFDPSVGLLRFHSEAEFRIGVRNHLFQYHVDEIASTWVIAPVRRTVPWAATIQLLTTP